MKLFKGVVKDVVKEVVKDVVKEVIKLSYTTFTVKHFMIVASRNVLFIILVRHE